MKQKINPIPTIASLRGLEPHQIRKAILDATPDAWKELFEGLLDTANLHIHEYWLRNILILLKLVRLVDDTTTRMCATLALSVIKEHKFAIKEVKQTIATGMEPFIELGDLKLNGIGWKTVTVIVALSCAATFGITKAYFDKRQSSAFRLAAYNRETGTYVFQPLPTDP